jgi:hypothetical protein
LFECGFDAAAAEMAVEEKRALICFLDKPPSDALMASRIRSAVWSPVDVPKKREALAEQ